MSAPPPTTMAPAATAQEEQALSLQLKYFALAELLSFSPHRLRACVDLMCGGKQNSKRKACQQKKTPEAEKKKAEAEGGVFCRLPSSTSSFREAPIDSNHAPALLLLALAVVYPFYGYNWEARQQTGAPPPSTTTTGCTSRIKAFFDRHDEAAVTTDREAEQQRTGSRLERAVAELAAPSFAHFHTYIQVKPATAGPRQNAAAAATTERGSSGDHRRDRAPLCIPPDLLHRHYQSFWRCLPHVFHVPASDSHSSPTNNCSNSHPHTSPTSASPTPPGSPAATAHRRSDFAATPTITIHNHSHSSMFNHDSHRRFDAISKIHALFPSFIPLVLELLLDLCFNNEQDGDGVAARTGDGLGGSTTGANGNHFSSRSGLAVYTRTARRAFLYLVEIYIPVYTIQCPYLPHDCNRCGAHAVAGIHSKHPNKNEKEEEEVKQTVETIRCCPPAQCESAMALLEGLQRLRRTFLQKIKMALLRHKYCVATSHNQQVSSSAAAAAAKSKNSKTQQQQGEDESTWVVQLSSTLLLSDLLPYLTVCTDHNANNHGSHGAGGTSMDFSFCCQHFASSEFMGTGASQKNNLTQQQQQQSHAEGMYGSGGDDVDEEAEKNLFRHFRSLLLEEYVCLLYQVICRRGDGCYCPRSSSSPSSSSVTEEGKEKEKRKGEEEETIQTLEKLIAAMHGSMNFPFLLEYYHKDRARGNPSHRVHKSRQEVELEEELFRHLQMIKDDHSDFCSINQYFVQSETISAATTAATNSNTSGGAKPTHNNSLFERLASSVFPSVIVHYITLMECTVLKRRFQKRWLRDNDVVPKRIDDAEEKGHTSPTPSADSGAGESQAEAAHFAWDLPSKVPGHVSLPYSSTMSCLTFFQLPVNHNDSSAFADDAARHPSPHAEGRHRNQVVLDEEDIANGSVVSANSLPSPSAAPTAPAATTATSTPKSVRMALAQWFIQALILYMAERQDCVLDAYHSLASPAARSTSNAGGSGGGGGCGNSNNFRAAAPSPSTPPTTTTTTPSGATSFFALFQSRPVCPATTYKAATPVSGATRQLPPPVQALPSVTTLLQLLQDCTVDFRRAVVVGGTLGSLRAVSRELRRWQETAPLAALLAHEQREAQESEDGSRRVAVMETERLTSVVLQICAQVAHGLLEDLREPLQTTSQLCLSAAGLSASATAMARPGATHADLEVLLRTVQCARAAIHAHQKGAPLSPDAQTALGFFFCRLARTMLQLPPWTAEEEGEAPPRHQQQDTPNTYLYAVQTARYLQMTFLTICSGLDALLHDYSAGCPAFLCEMLSGLCLAVSPHGEAEEGEEEGGRAEDGSSGYRSGSNVSPVKPTAATVTVSAPRCTFDLLKQHQSALWERSLGSLDTIEAAALVFYHAARRQRRAQPQQQHVPPPLSSPLHDRDWVRDLFTPSSELALYRLLRQQEAASAAAAAATSATPNCVMLHNVLLGRLPSSGDYEAEVEGGGGGGDGRDSYSSRDNNNTNNNNNNNNSNNSNAYANDIVAPAPPNNSSTVAAARWRHLRREERIVESMVQYTEYMLLFYQKEWLLDRTEVHPIFLLTI